MANWYADDPKPTNWQANDPTAVTSGITERVLAGDVTITGEIAAGFARNEYAIVGDVTVLAVPAAAFQFNVNQSIVGSVVMSAVIDGDLQDFNKYIAWAKVSPLSSFDSLGG